jgi:hypothetical protein
MDLSISNSEFTTFLKKNKDVILILDDAEIFLTESLYSKSNIFANNLIQLVDGLDSDELNLQIITIMNCDSEDDIDSHLFDTNNLLSIIEFEYLEKNKISELNKLLGRKSKPKQDSRLIDVLQNKSSLKEKNQIGFE